jgi:hypothetical protein
VIIATDCDREGQLIGQEILEHLSYRGGVQRALFTAQDPKTVRQAFATLKPNRQMTVPPFTIGTSGVERYRMGPGLVRAVTLTG